MEGHKRTLGISVLLTGLALAEVMEAGARTQTWTKVDLGGRDIWQNPAWTDSRFPWVRHRSPLASDHAGRVYFANGPTLFTLSRSGTQVDAFTPTGTPLVFERALAAGGAGVVLWGEYRLDPDQEGWITLDQPRTRSAYGIYRDGTAFGSAYLDGIERARPPYRDWTPVHQGRTFGQIERFVPGGNGTGFALPAVDNLLYSHDTGKTWRPWQVYGHETRLTGATVRALGLERTRGNPLFLAVAHPRDPGRASLVTSYVWYPTLDSIDIPIPDSLITSLAADLSGIWIGTRGRGVWTFRGSQSGLIQANEGLTNLHIEAMEIASDGTLYALARDGLYRIGPTPTGLAPLPYRDGRARIGRAQLLLPGLPGNPLFPSAVRIDGRTVLLPRNAHPRPRP